jgi:hypothetical protein
MSCFVASIGKLWGDGGLKDLLIESSHCGYQLSLSGAEKMIF